MRALSVLLLVLAAACAANAYKVRLNSGWVDANVGQLQPIPCTAGFRKARATDAQLMRAFLRTQLAQAMADTKSPEGIKRKLPAFFCPRGVQPTSLRYSAITGCVEAAARPSWAQAQGVVSYACVGGSKRLTLGVEGDGQFFA